jgi:hypothetical protein
MYVICRRNEGWENKLTVGKKYKVIRDSGTFWNVVCDTGYVGGWSKHYFKIAPSTLEDIYNSYV